MFEPNFIGYSFTVSNRDPKRNQTSQVNLVIQKFNQARQKSILERIKCGLLQQSPELKDLESVTKSGFFSQHYQGIQAVLIKDICGTFNRKNDFDRCFNPLDDRFKERWVNIALTRCKNTPLPPVDLVKVGRCFYVKDGHHRISVARAFGQLAIDAEVTTLNSSTTGIS